MPVSMRQKAKKFKERKISLQNQSYNRRRAVDLLQTDIWPLAEISRMRKVLKTTLHRMNCIIHSKDESALQDISSSHQRRGARPVISADMCQC